MTNDDVHIPSPPSGRQYDGEERGQLAVEARWEKTLVSAAGGDATLLVRVSAAPEATERRRVPLDVAFVLDRSGSMQGGKLDLAKEGVSLAVARLRDADRTALVVYDTEVIAIQPLAAATPRLKASLRLALHGVDPGGSTYLSGGWIAGCQELAEAPAIDEQGGQTRIRRVILLTDGLANVGMVTPHELARHASELRARGIATTTLGVGQDFDEGLLSAMAEAGGGNFQYAADAEALRAFFSRELQTLFRVTATGLTVTLALPPDTSADLVSAFPASSRGGAFDVAVGDVSTGDEIECVFTIHMTSGTIGERVPLGVIVSWTDPHADARRTIDASPEPLRRVEQHVVAAVPTDPSVTECAARCRAAAARRAGLELDRAGRFAESRASMMRSRSLLAAAPMTDAVRQDIEESNMLASAPVTSAYSSHQRKTAQYREDQRRRGRLEKPLDDTSGHPAAH
jgi:Ca-activated chloride channel family protein